MRQPQGARECKVERERTHPPLFLAYSTATSMRRAYSGFLTAARMSEGLVVASWGL